MSGDRYLIKLVRDRVGESHPKDRVAYAPIEDRTKAVGLLRGKLIEEAVEYLLDPSVGELADVLEAVKSLAEIDLNTDLDAVFQEADRKFGERGGFHCLVGMWAGADRG